MQMPEKTKIAAAAPSPAGQPFRRTEETAQEDKASHDCEGDLFVMAKGEIIPAQRLRECVAGLRSLPASWAP